MTGCLYVLLVINYMTEKSKSCGILGGGFVGSILHKYYEGSKLYDVNPDRCKHKLEEVLNSKVIFIAVNFLDNCASENSKKQLEYYFEQMTVGTVVVIKSTFLPGSTDFFQDKYPNLRFCYNPEFLTEMTAWNDFTKPLYQILGLPHNSLFLWQELFELLPDAPIKQIISPKDAETLKHAINSYFGTKVVWFNQLYDACQKIGADYETVRNLMIRHPWIGNSHSVIWHHGYRGYGGKCILKDLQAFQEIGDVKILEAVNDLNNELLKMQNILNNKV